MKSATRRRLLSAALLGCLGLLLGGCHQEDAASSGPLVEPTAQAASPPPDGRVILDADSPKLAQLRVEPLQAATVPVGSVTAPGEVELNANRLSHVVLPLPGRVTGVLVKMGDYVKQGQPLVTIESADAEAAVSAYQQALAGVTEADSGFTKAKIDLERSKDLAEHGAISQKEVLNAETLSVQAQAAVAQAQAVVEQARRRAEILGIDPNTYGQSVTVSAPISGKVMEMSVVNGEFRNDLSAPLMTIADLGSVWMTSDVPETAIRLVKVGEPVKIELTAYPGDTFHGKVTLIGDTVDPQTRTVKVRAELNNAEGKLKPEMFGSIQLAEQTEVRPTVPAGALIQTENATLVWRETQPGTFEKVPVTLGPQMGDRVAILSGLSVNDRVVVDGVMLLASK